MAIKEVMICPIGKISGKLLKLCIYHETVFFSTSVFHLSFLLILFSGEYNQLWSYLVIFIPFLCCRSNCVELNKKRTTENTPAVTQMIS